MASKRKAYTTNNKVKKAKVDLEHTTETVMKYGSKASQTGDIHGIDLAYYRRSSRILELERAKENFKVSEPLSVPPFISNGKKVVPAVLTGLKNAKKVAKESPESEEPNNRIQSNTEELSSSESATLIDDPEAAQKVKDALRIYNTYYLRAVQEEETRCQKEATKENVVIKKKDKRHDESEEPRKSRRPDLKAISQMRVDGKLYLNCKGLGHVPGINVGDHFYSRCEMMAVGLHSHWLAGIDYLGAAFKKAMPSRTFPVASSIVLSGCYEDDVDNAMDVVYTGQGGNDLLGKKHQIADQVMEKGNLALKNSMDQDLPVRLIRGNKTKKSYTGKVYTYDGLYKVKKYWAEKGKSGFTVYKFLLRRMEGQSVLTTDQVHFVSGNIPSQPSELRGLACADLSNGKERIPVPASNVVDKVPFAPNFRYLASNEVDKNLPDPIPAKGCNCKGGCYDVKKCSCAALNGKKFPYVSLNGGRLVEAVDVVYECGPQCGCGPSCHNRVTQRGIQYRLEVN
ncbi:hypothetical protein KP509_36G039200 [Ceratopteris richardii]|uniref:Uncharacterized protein n=1 Tax=Ceratopteris richardii TaxID=49495 RepID=A0A8T2QCG4_CERRI|nr:hypothetical protein KP509_36G039200 [Ceratopteris richardii]